MTTNYPASLDTTTQLPAAGGVGANLSTFPHSSLHGNANEAIIAIETELGTDPSGSSSTLKARLDLLTADVQMFTSGGTWNKPAGAVYVDVMVVGAGGGGGAGQRGAAGTTRYGGSGGAGGVRKTQRFPASALSSSHTITIGTGGSGAAGQSADTTNGADGSAGGSTSFGTLIVVAGGAAGQGGYSSGAGIGGNGIIFAAADRGGKGDGNPASVNIGTLYGTGSPWNGAGGGGGGRGYSTANVGASGGLGGQSGLDPHGVRAAAATAGQAYAHAVGGGGGGGGSTDGGTRTGGAGGLYGGGGGGGGASPNGTLSGAGGNGANGCVLVVTWS